MQIENKTCHGKVLYEFPYKIKSLFHGTTFALIGTAICTESHAHRLLVVVNYGETNQRDTWLTLLHFYGNSELHGNGRYKRKQENWLKKAGKKNSSQNTPS